MLPEKKTIIEIPTGMSVPENECNPACFIYELESVPMYGAAIEHFGLKYTSGHRKAFRMAEQKATGLSGCDDTCIFSMTAVIHPEAATEQWSMVRKFRAFRWRRPLAKLKELYL